MKESKGKEMNLVLFIGLNSIFHFLPSPKFSSFEPDLVLEVL